MADLSPAPHANSLRARIAEYHRTGRGLGIGWRLLLGAGAMLFGVIAEVRRWAFDIGIRRGTRLAVPVWSVGNLTTGGTGKTPIVIAILEHLIAAGKKPGLLARGYGAATNQGVFNDELELIAARLPSTPIAMAPDRIAGGRALLAQHPDVDVIVCDDAFSHRRLARDFDLVLIDASNPFGNRRYLPAGPLREAPHALGRAHAVVVTRADQRSAAWEREEPGINAMLDAFSRSWHPIARATCVFRPAAWGWLDGSARPAPARAIAACGIGNPQAFAQTLADAGVQVIETRPYPDHHAFTAADIDTLVQAAHAADAAVAVTEKDAVKISPLMADRPAADRERFAALRIDAVLDPPLAGWLPPIA
jgi:tetraacyldisaccharide 4'-kinase